MFHRFQQEDISRNVIKLYPEINFLIYGGQIYHNESRSLSGSYGNTVTHVPSGYINLYEMNVDRQQGELIYPFTIKNGDRKYTKSTPSERDYNTASYGDEITGSYPLSSSISVEHYLAGQTRPKIKSLKNTLDYYTRYSPHYAYSSSYGNKDTQEVTLINVPSIFVGSGIKKGTVDIEFFTTGTQTQQLTDSRQNGELADENGDVQGVVLYNEGIMLLTGSAEDMMNASEQRTFSIAMSGSQQIPVTTLFCHARRGELNHSCNPTYVAHGQSADPITGSTEYTEPDELNIKNVVKSPYEDYDEAFHKVTYVNSVGIYDEQRNLIGMVRLATPLKKEERRDFSIKAKLDF